MAEAWQRSTETRFPRSLEDLTDTGRCPACFTALHSPLCTNCGLDLRHPAAFELLELSRRTADDLAARAAVISRIRAETAAMQQQASAPLPPMPAAAAQTADATAETSAPASAPTAPQPAPVSPAPPAPIAPTLAAPTTDTTGVTARSGRSGVQLVLLIAGVSLLSIAAVFFLVYAFFTYGIVWQSIIVAGLTLASIGAAQFAARRRLRATAEGLAVFGTVLVLLDVWAIRQNDLFGTGSIDATLYSGAGLLAAVAVLWAWHGVGRLRAPGLAASGLLIVSLGLLASGVMDLTDRPLEVALAAGIAALGAVAQRFVRYRVDGALLAGTALIALLWAGVSSMFVERQQEWGSLAPMLVVALIAAVVGGSLITSRTQPPTERSAAPEARVFAGVAAGISGGLLAAATVVAIARMPRVDELLGWSLLAAVLVAAALELVANRHRGTRSGSLCRSGALGAGIVAALVAVLPVAMLIGNTAVSAGTAVERAWRMNMTESIEALPITPVAIALVGAAGSLFVITIAWHFGKVLARRWPLLAWAASALLLTVPALVEPVWLSVVLSLLIGAAAISFLVAARSRPLPGQLRAPLAFLALGATVIGGLIGWATPTTWAISAAVITALLLTSRLLLPAGAARAVVLGIAAVVTMQLVLLAPLAITGARLSAPIPYDGLLSVIVLAAIMIAIGAAPIRGLVAADRQVLFWISGAATAAVTLCVSAVGAPATVLLDARFAELVSSAALVSTIALWLWSPFTRRLTSTRIVAAAATGPAFAALLSAVLFAAPEVVRIAIPGASAVLVTLVALLVNTRRALAAAPDPSLRQRLPRWAADAGALAAAAITVLAAIASATQEGWLAALLLAAALFIASICSGRPFGFGSPRGLLVWPAVIIATAALWSRLAEGGTTELELYLLPPTLVLLLLAWWIERSRRRDDAASALLSRAAAAVILVALLLTLLPIAVISAGGSEPLRLPLVAAVSVILLLAGSALRHPIGQRLLDAVALAGALATITAVGGRALVLADREPERIAVDGWLALLVAALITAAVLLVRRNDDTRAQGHWSIAAMIAAITAIVVIESLATAAPGLALIRAVMAVLLLAALHVLALMVDRAPFSPAVGWTAIGGAAMLALVIVSTDRVDPLESVTVPIALALLATGAMRMLQHPQARSWPWLGPGLAVALLPSLLATTWEPALWRLVALGAASVAAAVIGATLRLQAPFLLGIAGALVHGVATFMPQLRTVYEAVEWWLWLGIGGAILIALAVRYERRIRDAREAVRRIRTMR